MKDIKCPDCNSKYIVKRGKRKGVFESTQVYRCKKCGRTFSDKSFKHKTYSARVVYNALNYYNLGNTLDQTSLLLNKRFKVKTTKTTIYSWLNKYSDILTIKSERKNFLDLKDVLFKKRFEHENLDYEFKYHVYKINYLAKPKFTSLNKYLLSFKQGCPDAFFEIGERCSQPKFDLKIEPKKITNLACKMASFAVHARKNNRERHELVENFMIINDKATIACEVPVWYWEKSIDSGITGHIDILQLRNDKVYILDYKPRAAKDKKAAQQLYHYAVALSFRAKVPFEKIMCAWFDEQDYFEYSPNDAKARLKRFN